VELPDPGAIASTGIDVISLNERATLNERQAMEVIHRYFAQWTIKGKTALSGYNVEDFDIPYLRTSFLRCGLFPYDHPISHDVLILVKTLFAYNETLRNEYYAFLKELEKSDSPRFSIRLEKVATFFSLLDRPQSHESEDDVNVTIALARIIADKYKLNIFSFSPYQIAHLHTQKGTLARLERPARSFQNPISQEDFVFLRTEGSASYWVEISQYQKWKKQNSDSEKTQGMPIKRMKFCEEAVRLDEIQPAYDKQMIEAASEIYKTFHNFNINELYPPKNCCAEQWMYRIPGNAMRLFCDSINHSPPKKLGAFNDDLNELWRRYLLSTMSDDGIKKNIKTFTQYALERYGPTPTLRLFDDDERGIAKNTSRFHPSLSSLQSSLETIKNELITSQKSDFKIHALNQLALFYEQSLINKVLN
jgi:hypothetical protein